MIATVVSSPRRPESVLVLVFTAGRDVLLLKRSRPFEFWQSVTGSLRAFESHSAAAARELAEETGLADEGALTFTGVSRQFAIDRRWRNRFAPGIAENVEYEYHYRLANTLAVALSADEHSESEWMPVGDAVERAWSWTNKAALQHLQAIL